MFEVHVVLLALSDFQSRLGEEAEHGGELRCLTLGHPLICHYEHRVAGKYGRVGVPAAVNCRLAAADVGIVHEVIVKQSVVVICLYGAGGHQDALGVVAPEAVREHHQYGAYAFSAEREHVADGFIERFGPAVVWQAGDKAVDTVKDFFRC